MKNIPAQKSKTLFVISLILVIILGLYTYRLISRLIQTHDNIIHTREIIKSLDLLFTMINDAESSRRGYVLTGNKGFLDNYTQSLQDLENNINQLKPMVHRNSNQQKQFDSLELLLREKINTMDQSIQSYRKNPANRTLQTRITEQGKKQMDAIRILHSESISVENRLLQNQMDLSRKQKIGLYITLFLVYMVILLFFIWVLKQVGRETDNQGKMDEGLESNVEIYKKICDDSENIIPVFSPDGKIISTNQGLRNSLDYSDLELKEISIFDLIHPEFRDTFKEIIQKLTAGETIEKVETVFLSRISQAIKAKGIISCRFQDNKPVSCYGVFRDITEKSKIEDENEQLINSTPDILAIVSYNGYFKKVNPTLEKVLGYTPDEISSKPYLDMVHPDDRDMTGNMLEKSSSEKTSVLFENRCICKDGNYKWLSWNAIPDVTNLVLYLTIQDITASKLDELEQKQLAEIVKSSGDAIIRTTLEGNITSWNPGAQKLFGYMENEMIGQPAHSLIEMEYQKEFIEKLEQLKKNDKIQNQELIGLTKDQQNINISFSITPLYDLSGLINGASFILQDITEKKLKEHQLEENQKIFHEMSTFDELTGLLNRKELFRQLNEEIIRAKRYKRPMTILMMDLDHLQKINNTHGHLAGDEVLKVVGQLIRQNKRIIDKAGRFGGEEILIILPETTGKTAFETAERFRKNIENLNITISRDNSIKIQITVSIGLATYPDDADMEDTLLSRVDRALYEAKRLGRNRTVLSQNIKSTDSLFE